MKLFITLILFINSTLFALNDEVRFDMLKIKLKNELESFEYKKAIKTFSKIRKYKEKLPLSYDFYEGKVNFEAKYYTKAYKLLGNYVSAVGRNGDYYELSLPMLLQIENKFEEKNKHKQKVKNLKRKKIFIDTNTNLMWQNTKKLFIGTYKNSEKYCSNLSLKGYKNWYLPNASQIKSINNKNKKYNILEGFKKPQNNKFWASNGNYSNKNSVWFLNFKDSTLYKIPTNSTKHLTVRCVRNK